MNILIIDDDNSRAIELKNTLVSNCFISEEFIFIVSDASSARRCIRSNYYDLVFLDVVIPNGSSDEYPSRNNGLELLRTITESQKFKKPGRIVGITVHQYDIENFRATFNEKCFAIIETSNRNTSWKQQLIDVVKYSAQSSVDNFVSQKDIVCLTVHGIRTRGSWQESLRGLIYEHLDGVDVQTYKYGYFTIISFFIPFLRVKVIRKFTNCLERFLVDNNKKNVFMFSHSFGTYVLISAIEKIIKKDKSLLNGVECVVLSGSVLKSTYDFNKILNATGFNIINDCGASDNVLLLSEAFVPNTGMAGRIGFHGLNNSRFTNRFYNGGHSHYFDVKSGFMKKYWLPLFTRAELVIIDERGEPYILVTLVEKIISFIGRFKESIYLLFLIFVALWFSGVV